MPECPLHPSPVTSAIAETDMPRRAALALAGAAAAAAFVPSAAPPAAAQPAAAPEAFIAIPDWFSFENQDVGVTVTDLPAVTGAQQHLVVLMVDNGPQANRGVYRLGKALDANGAVTGGWTPWVDVPDWFPWENAGADIAVADLGNTGGRDLVVLMVDNAPQQNRGLYRVGKALDANGNVTGGWTPWVDVPDWFPWENQGAGIAVTPPNAQGNRDLVVLMVDNGPQANRGVYRLGNALDANGNVTGGWTPWLDVPDWLPWENAGAGIAVLPSQGGGAPGLVAFQIDSAPVTAAGGQNGGFFRIGTGLGASGAVGAWQQQWLGVPHWFSWENQGGAVAVATIGGRRRLFVLMADSPPGQNGGFYQTVDLDPDPALQGRWETLGFPSKVLPVHAATLPGGAVLFFAGSGGSAHRFNDQAFGDVAAGAAMSVVWTPPSDAFVHPPTLDAANGKPYDFFCGGDAFLPDGRMLSVGGTIDYGPFNGRKEAAVFDPANRTWSFVAPMAQARWYPTAITLGDGRVLAASGLNAQEKKSLELYSATTNTWQTVALPGNFNGLPLYAHLFGMADGRVCFSGGRMDDGVESGPCIIDLGQNPVGLTPIGGLAAPGHRNQATSVLLGPAQEQRVMVCGGGPNPRTNMAPATGNVGIVNLGAANPAYAAVAPMGLPRMHHNTVLLPDRTVFVTGGSLQQESAPLARLQPELYDPAANTWRTMATATVPRLYHATALLLADGRVVAAGGNPNGGHSTAWLPPDPEEEMRLEIFSPPYLFRGPRPVISNAPDQCAYGQTLVIASPQGGSIRWASLIRNGVTTHSFDGSQRLVDLPIASQGGGEVRVAVTGNRNLAPPGWYMLFLVNQQGVPSVAHWTRLG